MDPISCLLLVTYDTLYGDTVPVILGTNHLRPFMTIAERTDGPRYEQTLNMGDAVYFGLRYLELQSQNLKISSRQFGVIKCAKVIIPKNITISWTRRYAVIFS